MQRSQRLPTVSRFFTQPTGQNRLMGALFPQSHFHFSHMMTQCNVTGALTGRFEGQMYDVPVGGRRAKLCSAFQGLGWICRALLQENSATWGLPSTGWCVTTT